MLIILIAICIVSDSVELACQLKYCTACSSRLVKCHGFEKFSDLNLTSLNLTEVEVLDIEPVKGIILDNSLQINTKLLITKNLILRNLKGIHFKGIKLPKKNNQLKSI